MAQVLVNFRIDEDVKKDMEQACREMGLSMSTAFAIFAKKVGREKRIPFEIAVEPSVPELYRRQRRPAERGPGLREEASAFPRKQERLEQLCAAIRRSLTAIHTAIPSSITGLTMERIRMLCGDELKDKAAEITGAVRKLFSGRNAEALREKDGSLLDEYTDRLSSAARELAELEHTLIPAMKAGRGESGGFEPYEQRLAAVSRELDELPGLMQRFLRSAACDGGARMVQARIRQAVRPVETPYILTALDNLEAQLLRHYDAMDDSAKARLESDYLPTLERTLQTLGRAEQDGEDAAEKAALCLRAVNVLSQVVSDARQVRREWDARDLEAEVTALERMAAMRGDIAGGLKPEA